MPNLDMKMLDFNQTLQTPTKNGRQRPGFFLYVLPVGTDQYMKDIFKAKIQKIEAFAELPNIKPSA